MPPGVVPIGHFLEKTAILRTMGGEGLSSKNESLFHANSAKRRSPDQAFVVRVVHMELVVEVWRRKSAGMVQMKMKKRVMQRLK